MQTQSADEDPPRPLPSPRKDYRIGGVRALSSPEAPHGTQRSAVKSAPASEMVDIAEELPGELMIQLVHATGDDLPLWRAFRGNAPG
jgi:hypothetical protein